MGKGFVTFESAKQRMEEAFFLAYLDLIKITALLPRSKAPENQSISALLINHLPVRQQKPAFFLPTRAATAQKQPAARTL
jgi:hypothetical protein